MSHSVSFLNEAVKVLNLIDVEPIERMADSLVKLRDLGGRLFLIGVGGSAGNCSHATNDFRKLCGIETYAAVDNVSELTARANDEGFDTIFSGWLKISKLGSNDAILILSVGGGSLEKNVSVNIIRAIELAKSRGSKVFGIVGRASGYTALNADLAVIIPETKPDWVTPLSEAFQGLVWHSLVSNPKLQIKKTKW